MKKKIIKRSLTALILLSMSGLIFLLYYFLPIHSPVCLKKFSRKNLENSLKMSPNLNDTNFIGIGGAYLPDITSPPVCYFDYTIQKGDSIHSISKKFGIDEVTIIKLNQITIPSNIHSGKKIIIPNQDGIKVKINNNLEKVASKYDYEKEDLLRINNIEKANSLISELFIPGIHFDSVSKSLMLGEYFRRPAYGRFTSYYGYRIDPWTKKRAFHTGVDIANRRGSYIYAAAPGKVIYSGYDPILGYTIKIQHTSGYVSYYGHLSRFFVKPGKWVAAGTVIGLMGNTGRSTGNHLHFEIRRYGRTINPFRITIF